ncbi:MAG: 30S ribosomal protein S4 [bacterium]
MARYTGSKCKICRKYKERLYLKGDRCFSDKCPLSREQKKTRDFRRKESEYAKHLKEKQKARAIFGIRERQQRKTFETAARKKGLKGENLLKALCLRLDNIVYRSGFASSLQEARQIVGHRFVKLNARVCNIPSREVRVGDAISLTDKGKKLASVKNAFGHTDVRVIPDWLKLEKENFSGSVVRDLNSEDLDQLSINHRLIVEFYSR